MNHYANSTHAELYCTAACAAGSLRDSVVVLERIAGKKPIIGAQRRRIRSLEAYGPDRTLADLLEALGHQVHHGQHIEGGAEQPLVDPGATLRSVFGPKLAETQRNARYRVILDAAGWRCCWPCEPARWT